MAKRHDRVYPEVFNPNDYSYDQPGIESDSKMLMLKLFIIYLLINYNLQDMIKKEDVPLNT